MPTPRAHHYLPQCYLRGFCEQGKGRDRLWVYEVGKPPRHSTPRNEAHQRDLYAFAGDQGRRDVHLEQQLAVLESRVAEILPQLGDRRFAPTEREREDLKWFVALLFNRVPEAFRVAREIVAPASRHLLTEAAGDGIVFRNLVQEEFPDASPEEIEQERQEFLSGRIDLQSDADWMALAGMVESTRQGVEAFEGFGLQFLHADDASSFITSDHPVVTFQGKEGGLHIGCTFRTEGVMVWVPMTQRVALCMGKSVVSTHLDLTGYSVRNLNRAVMMCSVRWVFAPENSTKVRAAFDKYCGTFKRGRDIFVPSWNGKQLSELSRGSGSLD